MPVFEHAPVFEEHNNVMPIVEPAHQPEESASEVVGSGKPTKDDKKKPIKHVDEKKKSVHKKT